MLDSPIRHTRTCRSVSRDWEYLLDSGLCADAEWTVPTHVDSTRRGDLQVPPDPNSQPHRHVGVAASGIYRASCGDLHLLISPILDISVGLDPSGSSPTRKFSDASAASLSAGVRLQALGPGRMAQLQQTALLDLADALPRQPELASDLVEGAGPTVVEAEPQADDGLLTL